jgi:hypothetical protein
MSSPIIHVGEGFWNIRGSYKIGGLVDVGTQASLARLASGNFVLLDSYSFNSETRRKVAEMKSTPRGTEKSKSSEYSSCKAGSSVRISAHGRSGKRV